MHKQEFFRGLIRIFTDGLSALLAWGIAYLVRPYSDLIPGIHLPQSGFMPELEIFLPVVFLSTLGLLAVFASLKLYSYPAHYANFSIVGRIFWGIFLWVLGVLAIYGLVLHELFFSRMMLFHAAFFTVFFAVVFRVILRIIFEKIFPRKRKTLVIGTDDEKNFFIKNFSNSQYEIIKTPASRHPRASDSATRGSTEESYSESLLYGSPGLHSAIAPFRPRMTDIDDIFLFESEKNYSLLIELRELCAEKGIIFHSLPNYAENFSGHAHLEIMRGVPIITASAYKSKYWWMAGKRIFDIFASLFFILLFSPIFLVFSILIKLDSKGPILYVSERIGRNGKKFSILKFRSMVVNAEELKEKIAEKSHRDGPFFKIKNDPRITQVGKFLRKTSLDEIPQFFNVLIGTMSLIGPRPHLASEVEKYSQAQKRVLSVKPGISGLAQVSGRSDLSFEEEIFLDKYYAENSSFWLDIKIFLKTPFVLLFGKGAD